ncbi:MAG TPA: efflux RND transporter periplasmic adaptor subunit [Kofleriaceae bacterium]|nr:efflux RND transporter periplasmic adaptor subunit [Kofleriaceae bacterium]
MFKSTKSKLGAALLLTAVATGGVAWTRSNAPAAPAITAPVATVLVAPGLIEAEGDRVELGFEASGRIVELVVDEGDVVTAGQLLGRLDDRVAQARVAKAEAAVAVAKARRDAAMRGARADEIKAAIAESDAAAAAAKERGIARDRAEALLSANPEAIPMAEVDTARGLADASAAQARAAAARASLTRAGSRVEIIAEAKAAHDVALADLEEARAFLAQHELKAPRAGTVIRRLHEVGEHVTTMPPTTVLIVADTSKLELRVEVDEVDVARVKLGQVAWATALAYGDQKFSGRVTRVVGELGRKTQRLEDPRARIDTRVLEVVVTLDEAPVLPLGLRMDVHLEPGK